MQTIVAAAFSDLITSRGVLIGCEADVQPLPNQNGPYIISLQILLPRSQKAPGLVEPFEHAVNQWADIRLAALVERFPTGGALNIFPVELRRAL